MIEKFELKFTKSRGNIYHVPLKQWRKWNDRAHEVFNEVFSSMNGAQGFFSHPKMEKMSRAHWKTICWNAAWAAATAANA